MHYCYVPVLCVQYPTVRCELLNTPNNGMMICSLSDDGAPSTCSFTCNTGYKLTGSDTRTCQSNGSWSGSETICTRGQLGEYYVYVA